MRLCYIRTKMLEASPYNDSEIRRINLLKSVRIKAIEGLLKRCTYKEFAPDEVIIAAGQINYMVYMILSGSVRVHVDHLEDEPLVVYERGEIFGEISVIDQRPTTASVVANTPCRTLVMDEEILLSLVTASHAACRNLLNILAQRLRYGTSVISKSNFLKRQFEYYANIDVLTGLYNRRWLNDMFGEIANRCKSGGRPLTVIMADIDHFKAYNDTHGHIAGDRALYTVAVCLLGQLRKTDFAVRYGGEEFLVILPGTDIKEGRLIAERLRISVKETPIVLHDSRQLPSLTISLGIAGTQEEQTSEALIAETLIDGADKALYRAKSNGRNSVCP
ncbi:MAG: GGDEF domain-containing protein [Nitrospirae bacterium]|nr:GGDEF domain-containing protein [Nitrospirota bacterium]